MRWIALMLGVGVLSGCGSMMQSDLNENGYIQTAALWAGAEACSNARLVDTQTATAAYYFARSNVTGVNYDQQKLDAYTNKARKEIVASESFCNSLAQAVEIRKMEEQRFRQNVQRTAPPSTLPVQTNCSTYFGQTHCTTF